MPDAIKLNYSLYTRADLLTIKERYPFKKIFHKIKHSGKKDFVFVQKPKASQMAAVILARITGKKLYWIQGFSNPPKPNFLTRLLLNEADLILVNSKKTAANLRSQGIDKPKIKLGR